jgi:hypothetical protein
VIDLTAVRPPVARVVSFTWLPGYHAPTLLLLHEPIPGWAGAGTMDTRCLSAFSIDVTTGTTAASAAASAASVVVLWSVPGLPADAHTALPLPAPLHGVLLLGVNTAVHVVQSAAPTGATLNSLAAGTTKLSLPEAAGPAVALDSAHTVLLGPRRVLVAAKDGTLYSLRLDSAIDPRRVSGVTVRRIAAASLPAGLTRLHAGSGGDDLGFIFVASTLGNSMLLKASEVSSKPVETEGDAALPPAAKRLFVAMDAEDEDLYGSSDAAATQPVAALAAAATAASTAAAETVLQFSVCDSIVNVGPVASMAMVRVCVFVFF